MNILIVGNFPFPFGSAGASRIRHFALGLSEAGASVRVISRDRLYDRPEDIGPAGKRSYSNIPYESALGMGCEFPEKRSTFDKVSSNLGWLQGVRKVAKRAREIILSEKVDAIIQYERSYFAIQPFIRLCREHHVALIQDVVEWPDRHFFYGGVLNPRYVDTKLAMNKAIVQSDGVIGISQFLVDFYADRHVPSICVPAIIKIPERPPGCRENKTRGNEFNVTYLGRLFRRDCPFEMIGAIRKVLAKGLPVRFTIVGSSGLSGFALKIKRACECDELLRDKIGFLGRVSDEEVQRSLRMADALLFARPDDISAKAAFPTRLPEYLLSERPVIVAGVGDIPRYLRDGIDAMVVRPCTADNIADRIEQLMMMPDRGQAIGANGFQRAIECFEYRSRTQEILAFIQRICETRKVPSPFVAV